MRPSVKICGLRNIEAAHAAQSCGADYLGFIFYPPSPRAITLKEAEQLRSKLLLKDSTKLVAVMVNPSDVLIAEIIESFQPHMLQLHGDEPPQRVAEIKARFALPVIKAIAIAEAQDIEGAYAYSAHTDALLFDTKSQNPAIYGGTGKTYNWEWLKGHHFSLPWFLSGGLGKENLLEALEKSDAHRVDLSSSLESVPGVKDLNKIRECLEIVRPLH